MNIILLGDSITQGLGSKKINFTKELQRYRMNDAITNFALTGTTILYVQEKMQDILQESPDVVIIIYGNVDAQLKPSRNGKIFKNLPKRFGHLDGSRILPRPYYSQIWYKNLGQHIENIIRSFFRNLIYFVDGAEQWVSIDEFKRVYETVWCLFRAANIRVLCCSSVFIDDKLFPGSNAQYMQYNDLIKHIADEIGCGYLDLHSVFETEVTQQGWNSVYNFDHFHPNGKGYEYMAKWIDEALNGIVD